MPVELKRKVVELPVSGDKLTVRELQPYDYTYLGGIPDSFAEYQGRTDVGIGDLKPKDLDFVIKATCMALVKHPEGQRIVTKRPEDCQGVEVSFLDLPFADQEALVDAVFSVQKGGSGDKPSTFPEKEK